MDFQSLDLILQQFENLFTNGVATVYGHTIGYLQIFAFFDLLLALMLHMADGIRFQQLVNKIMKISFWVFIVAEYETWLNAIVDSFTIVGLDAGGGNIGSEMMKRPSILLNQGMRLSNEYLGWAKDTNTGIYAFFENMDILIPAYIGSWIIIGAFIFIILQVFITYIEFYVFGLLALFFLAFAVFNKTSFISEKVIGGVISYGVKLMFLACILSAIGPIIESLNFTVHGTPDFDMIVGAVTCCLVLAFLAWQAPAMAAGLMNGSPSLTGGTVASNAVAGMAGGAAAGMAAMGIAGMAGGMVNRGAGLAGAMAGGARSVDQYTTPFGGAMRGAFSHMAGGLTGSGSFAGGVKGSYTAGFETGSNASAAHEGSPWGRAAETAPEAGSTQNGSMPENGSSAKGAAEAAGSSVSSAGAGATFSSSAGGAAEAAGSSVSSAGAGATFSSRTEGASVSTPETAAGNAASGESRSVNSAVNTANTRNGSISGESVVNTPGALSQVRVTESASASNISSVSSAGAGSTFSSSAGGVAEAAGSAASSAGAGATFSSRTEGENTSVSDSSAKQESSALNKMAVIGQAERAVPPEAHPSGGIGFHIKNDD